MSYPNLYKKYGIHFQSVCNKTFIHYKEPVPWLFNIYIYGYRYQFYRFLKAHGIHTIMPKTLIINNYKKLLSFLKKYKKIILKKEIHKQKGLKICTKESDLKNFLEYSIAQQWIPSTGVNYRVYLIIINKNRRIYWYVYHDGIVSYIQKDNPIASFYTSNYQENPILISSVFPCFIHHIYSMLKDLSITFYIFQHPKCSYHIFGCDFIIDKITRKPYLVEINVFPGMQPYDQRDYHMRDQLFQTVFQLLKKLT